MQLVMQQKKCLTDIEMFSAKQLPLQNENAIYIFLSNASET